jgi:hypothetical protein
MGGARKRRLTDKNAGDLSLPMGWMRWNGGLLINDKEIFRRPLLIRLTDVLQVASTA